MTATHYLVRTYYWDIKLYLSRSAVFVGLYNILNGNSSFSIIGEIGGNMGLFLGCSLLTICEFLDFFMSYLAARNRNVTHPA